MTDREIDALLKRAGAGREADPALVERLAGSAGRGLTPVRPLPSAWQLAARVAVASAVLAIAGALLLGPHGIRLMSGVQEAAIFPLLALWMALAAAVCVAEAIPGSRRMIAPWLVVVCVCVTLAAVFAGVFHNYATEQFVSQGMRCLVAGLAQAVPAAAATWWILRRGFAVNPRAAGFAGGALAGLAGVLMLEIHCPNFEAPHVMVWHVAVVPLAGAMGMLAARMRAGR